MSKDLAQIAEQLLEIDDSMVEAEKDFDCLLEKIHPENKKCAVNLLHYLALRSQDIRDLQDDLHACGLSSMASSESHIRGQLLAILKRLGVKKKITDTIFSYETSKLSLSKKLTGLFGKRLTDSVPYIMVTFDNSLATDYSKVENLLLSGMNIARINCAHDDQAIWHKMVENIDKAIKMTGLQCKIYMDLAGPKIRTIVTRSGRLKVVEGQMIYLTDENNINDRKLTVGCTIVGIFNQVNTGETVLFDDGLIEARVDKIEPKRVRLQILRVSSKKPYIKNEKGVNFPNSNLMTPSLTDYDVMCIPFIVQHADMIGYSFVRNSDDILQLQHALGNNKQLDLVIKIETPQAVKNLPDLLLSGMQQENIGVMIARGDLAVEIGFERMSEIQEEILWISESAHVPVIWATQVLENLNKSGVATRSEITDAAHAAQADCVMINKGAHTLQTLDTLKNILFRSGGHHIKKRFTFRPLAIATRFMNK